MLRSTRVSFVVRRTVGIASLFSLVESTDEVKLHLFFFRAFVLRLKLHAWYDTYVRTIGEKLS